MDANGANVVQLTDHIAEDYSPTWSPDGKRILFVSERDEGWRNSEIYMMNADGSGQQRVTDNISKDFLPVWSPDQSKIAFIKTSKLAILTFEGQEIVEQSLPFATGKYQRPAWSSDGSQIAISNLSNLETSRIQIFSLDGTEAQSFVLQGLEFPKSLSWSQSGDFIFFSASDPNGWLYSNFYSEDHSSYSRNWNIYALDLTSGEVVQVTFADMDEYDSALWP
jgi:Tol biopolymer transport system component